MFARLAYVLSALLLGASVLVGVQFSSAIWTDTSGSGVSIGASPDWTPPTVAMDDPGYAQWGTVTVSATASDSISAIASVAIEYRPESGGDWTSLCSDFGAPYTCSWNTTLVDDGVYLLRATASDAQGNSAISADVSTEVRNTPGMVIDPVPSPTRGTLTLTGRIVNGGPGPSVVKFQYAFANNGNGPWTDIPGCSDAGPEGSCNFNTAPTSGTFDMRAVGTINGQTYYAVQTDIVIDNAAPTVTVNKSAGQADPTTTSPISFTVVFSEPVSGFTDDDVVLGGTSGGTKVATVSGSGSTYTVSVTGMSGDGSVTASLPAGSVLDQAGNGNTASTSSDNSVQYDGSPLTVTINEAAAQADPTNGSTINFTVVFSRTVTGFATGDVTISGTTSGTKTATVTGSGSTYNVAVTGMTSGGTVTATIAAGLASDGYGNPNEASTSTDNIVTRDLTAPTVTINQAAGQSDPTNSSSINFTVVFSEPVTGFATGDVTIGGTTSGTEIGTVTGSGTTYNVAVTGMTSGGTVIASIAAARALDLAGNTNTASTSTDNTVTRDVTAPTVTVVRASGQGSTSTASTLNFTVTFNETVTGFETGDVTFSGTAQGTLVGTVTGSGQTYNVAVTGMTTDGTVIANVTAGVAHDIAGNANNATASLASGRTVTWSNGQAPSVTVNKAAGQADPTNGSYISFAVEFSEPVTGLLAADFTVSSQLGGSRFLSGSGSSYTLTVYGMTQQGTVTVSLPASRATDLSGTANTASTSTDNSVVRDSIAPTVTLNKAAGQADPGTGSQVDFTVVFSESVADFESTDVTIGGTAGATTATVTGSGTTYTVRVTGMTTTGTVVASIPAGRATDAAGNDNAASTSTDNSVSWMP